jgi:hypothetical protein
MIGVCAKDRPAFFERNKHELKGREIDVQEGKR